MRTRVVLVGAFLLLASLAFADEWKKDYPVGEGAELRVDTNDASVHVTAVDGKAISARVVTSGYKIGPGDVTVTEHQTGSRVELRVKIPSRMFVMDFGTRSVRIEVQVPSTTKLDVSSSDGSLHLAGLRAQADLRTSDGSIEVRDHQGTLRAKTSDGSMHIDGRFENLDLHTSDGSIQCDVRSGSRVATPWSVESADGSIRLNVPAELAANLEMHTGDGHIELNPSVTVNGSISRTDVRGRLNGGGPLLKVRTSDGSIHLGRS